MTYGVMAWQIYDAGGGMSGFQKTEFSFFIKFAMISTSEKS